jgi:hypothetical protein
MHKYRVVENEAGQPQAVLEGGLGRFHAVRVLSGVVQVGDVLCGSRPHLGFGLLRSLRSGASVRVIFETINDTDDQITWPGQARAVPALRAAP